jgi:hypothetical protein
MRSRPTEPISPSSRSKPDPPFYQVMVAGAAEGGILFSLLHSSPVPLLRISMADSLESSRRSTLACHRADEVPAYVSMPSIEAWGRGVLSSVYVSPRATSAAAASEREIAWCMVDDGIVQWSWEGEWRSERGSNLFHSVPLPQE